MSKKATILSLGFLGAIGAWFANKNRTLQTPDLSEGEGDGMFAYIADLFKGMGSSSPAPVTRGPLPTNRPLSRDEVFELAADILRVNSFLGTAQDLTITAYIESSFRPWVYRNEKTKSGAVWDTSWGLMQTLLGTARDMYAKGYRAMGEPTADKLKTPETSMYFGAAYKDWLRRNYAGRSPEWYIRAYNGGPGWEKTQSGPANTAVYLQRYLGANQTLFGGA
jgi:hypothetical protein